MKVVPAIHSGARILTLRPVRRRWRLPPWLVLLVAVLLGVALLARAVAT